MSIRKLVLKKVCSSCGYWTKDPKGRRLKCYCGSCPAKARDNSNQLHEIDVKIAKLESCVRKLQERKKRKISRM